MQNIQQKSVPLIGSKSPGFSEIYRNSDYVESLLKLQHSHFKNLRDIFVDAYLNKFPNNKCIGKIQVTIIQKDGVKSQNRQIVNELTYVQVFNMAKFFGSGIINEKLLYENQDKTLNFLGIYTKNRFQFNIADLACILYGETSVPLYDTLGFENLSYCLKQTNLTTLICSGDTSKIINKLQQYSNLKNIILLDKISEQLEKQLSQKFKLYTFQQIIQAGKKQIVDYQKIQIQGDKCFTFCYTSGTTGPPKGAMLSHRNYISFILSFNDYLRHNPLTQKDVYLSLLPMPHVFQRIVVTYMFTIGAFVVPYSGNMLKLKDDMFIVKPTFFAAVPRIYNRFADAICQKVGGQENLRKMIQGKSPVLEKIRQSFGGKINMMVTGSAPINIRTQQLLGGVMNCPFFQGYGQTQHTGAGFIQNLNNKQYGSLGPVIASLQFKLADISQMNYTSQYKDQNGNLTPRGEIWFKGDGVFLGYYKDQQKTKQTITQDGWLKTGDVGEILTHNFNRIRIIDRKKNIFKLQQGQYVACQKVQGRYIRSKYVQEVFLHGDSHQNFAVAIVVANKPELMKLAKQIKLQLQKSIQQICNQKLIIQAVLNDLNMIGQQSGLKGFQQAKNIRIDSQGFIQRGLVSSTMKLQRFKAKQYYQPLINQMYTFSKTMKFSLLKVYNLLDIIMSIHQAFFYSHYLIC